MLLMMVRVHYPELRPAATFPLYVTWSLSLDVTWSHLMGVANIDLRKWTTNVLTGGAYNDIHIKIL